MYNPLAEQVYLQWVRHLERLVVCFAAQCTTGRIHEILHENIHGVIFIKVFQSLWDGILKYRGLIILVPGVLVCRNST